MATKNLYIADRDLEVWARAEERAHTLGLSLGRLVTLSLEHVLAEDHVVIAPRIGHAGESEVDT